MTNYKAQLVTILLFSLFSLQGLTHSSRISEINSKTKETYITKGILSKLDPKVKTDAEKLANSVEFEVYTVRENTNIHTIFESGAGVCRGYKEPYGVDITDSATYYSDQDKKQYYVSISSATVNEKGSVQNLRYATIYNLNNPQLSKHLQEQEKQYGKTMAEQNLLGRANTHLKDVCK